MDAKEFFGEWSEVIDFSILDKILNTLGYIIQTKEICPAPENLFRVFECCKLSDLKVVAVALDPYPTSGTATGIAFGNKEGTLPSNFSPSLKVLYNAVQEYCSFDLPFSTIDSVFPTLESWCKQGVLLLNSALSVEVNKVGSHSNLWKPFTKSLLANLQKRDDNLIFVLMGDVAQSFKNVLNQDNVICCPHPARCARTGEKFPNIFEQIDKKMMERGKQLIWWI